MYSCIETLSFKFHRVHLCASPSTASNSLLDVPTAHPISPARWFSPWIMRCLSFLMLICPWICSNRVVFPQKLHNEQSIVLLYILCFLSTCALQFSKTASTRRFPAMAARSEACSAKLQAAITQLPSHTPSHAQLWPSTSYTELVELQPLALLQDDCNALGIQQRHIYLAMGKDEVKNGELFMAGIGKYAIEEWLEYSEVPS